MPCKIISISSYKKIADLFSEVYQEFSKNIIVKIGDLESGAKKVITLEEQGIDVIISRGGTAIAIKKKIIVLPAVEVQVSGFDLIRALHQARK